MHVDETGRFLDVDGRRFPLTEWESDDLAITSHVFRVRRAAIGCENGWVISVVWGTATYSDNHDDWHGGAPFVEDPLGVEVGVIEPGVGLSGDPFGYVDAAGLVLIVDAVDKFPSGRSE